MAPLPLSRLKTSLRAFSRTAVDFIGPYITVQGRGKSRQKRYLCLFTCLATRAVHLEVAFGLDTSSFLNAFYRMVNRRGIPEEIYSDNATNFKAADKELKALLLQLDEDKIKESTSNKGIVWHFTPPLASHFGGVHESMIKSAKKALNAILGNADITDEELMTALTGAEALVNSLPLTYQSANPHNDIPLTPNHFCTAKLGVISLHHQSTARSSIFESDGAGSKSWFGISGIDGCVNGFPPSALGRNGTENIVTYKSGKSSLSFHRILRAGTGHWGGFSQFTLEQTDGCVLPRFQLEMVPWLDP